MDYLAEIAKAKPPFPPLQMPRQKRIFDIVMSILLLIVLSPLIAIILILFLFEEMFVPTSRGPLLYTETRISKGQPFKIYKFRIFKIAAGENFLNHNGLIHTKALESDQQNLTLLGRLLKQIYMDELPQLLNVLRGEMSLVGPRPTNVAVTWRNGQAGNWQRYLITAGLTGPFQAEKGGKPLLGQNQVDMAYINFCRNASGWKIVWRDCRIIVRTCWTVLKAKGV